MGSPSRTLEIVREDGKILDSTIEQGEPSTAVRRVPGLPFSNIAVAELADSAEPSDAIMTDADTEQVGEEPMAMTLDKETDVVAKMVEDKETQTQNSDVPRAIAAAVGGVTRVHHVLNLRG